MNETKSENYCLITEDEFKKTQVEVAKELPLIPSFTMCAFLALYQSALQKKLFPKNESEEKKANDLKE